MKHGRQHARRVRELEKAGGEKESCTRGEGERERLAIKVERRPRILRRDVFVVFGGSGLLFFFLLVVNHLHVESSVPFCLLATFLLGYLFSSTTSIFPSIL
jgi:hypothetical protein